MHWLQVKFSAFPFDEMSCRIVNCTTGASSGIGAATAVHFAKLGYRLAICGRNEVALAETVANCLKANDSLTSDDVGYFLISNLSYIVLYLIFGLLLHRF